MTNPAPQPPEKKKASAVVCAFFVPIVVVMAQSAWVVQGWNFRHNALLANVSDPIVLGGMAIVAVISFFAIRPFARRASSRLGAFLACVLIFTMLIELLLPHIAE